jgi:hypothetical protein
MRNPGILLICMMVNMLCRHGPPTWSVSIPVGARRDASDFRGVRSAERPVSIDLGNSTQLLTSGRVAQLRVVCRRSGN